MKVGFADIFALFYIVWCDDFIIYYLLLFQKEYFTYFFLWNWLCFCDFFKVGSSVLDFKW